MAKPITADLHLHTTFSDGTLTPGQVSEKARESGISMIAITDHDSFDGSRKLQMISGNRGFSFLSAELSMRDMKGLHLLVYGRQDHLKIHEKVYWLQNCRDSRLRQMIDKLDALGMPLEIQNIISQSEGSHGRPHLAREMVRKGYVQSVREAFERYLGEGKPAYVGGERLNMKDAIQLTRSCGYIPVLAHPYEIGSDQLEPLVRKWADDGLMGIEVYHPSAISHGFHELSHMAERYHLLITGGSDFHTLGDSRHGSIGCMMPYWQSCEDDLEKLIEMIISNERRGVVGSAEADGTSEKNTASCS